MKNLFNLLFLIIPFVLSAQNSGIVTYSETLSLNFEGLKIEGEGINSEEILAMMPKESKKETSLLFNEGKSLYQNIKEEKSTNQNLGAGISFNMANEETYIYYDADKKESLNKTNFFSRDFIVISEANESKWKITKEQKMIQGFLCFKAVRTEEGKSEMKEEGSEGEEGKITFGEKNKETVIWFTPQVKVDAAPAGIMDVPGLVLRVEQNEGKLIIEATKVELGEVDGEKIVAPTKGKKITQDKMEKIKKKKIEEMKSQFQGGGEDSKGSFMIISN